MTGTRAEGGFLRIRQEHHHHRVTYVELFFDLVFVYAITQISHGLLAHLSPLGLLQTTMLMLAVWWVWVFTSWVTNWLDPERTAVRLALFVMMVAGLILSASIPDAFGERGLGFALAYVAMQIGRSAFMVWSIPPSQAALRINFLRILLWLTGTGVLWIAGGLAEGEMRIALWGIALIIEYLSPALRFRVPGLGASSLSDWNVEGGHMSERCALFIIIALGESILVTGATFAETAWTPATIAAFGIAFPGSIAMWWIYFDKSADAASNRIMHSSDPGRLARLAYTYLHVPIVAGIIVSAVADELVLAHPTGHTDMKMVLSIIGGPMLFLLGMLLFKRTMRGLYQLSHITGIIALLVLSPLGFYLPTLAFYGAVTLILIVVAAWEARSLTPNRKAA